MLKQMRSPRTGDTPHLRAMTLLLGALLLLSNALASAKSEGSSTFLHVRSPTTEAEAGRRNAEDAKAFKAIQDLAAQQQLDSDGVHGGREKALLREVQERGSKANAMSGEELRALRSLGVDPGRPFGSQGFFEVEVPTGRDAETLAAQLKQSGFTAGVAPPPFVANSSPDPIATSIPNDFSFSPEALSSMRADHLWQMKFPEAWTTVTGGRSFRVCQIDQGGFGFHNELTPNLGPSFNADPAAANVIDPTGHSTHVAGIIAAQGNDGTGVVGSTWRITLLSCRVSSYNVSQVATCLRWCREQNARVQIMPFGASWSGSGSWPAASTTFYDAMVAEIRQSRAAGHLIITSAGNNGWNLGRNNIMWAAPACLHALFPGLENMITVGSVNANYNRAPDSNFGTRCVHMFAAGVNIPSTSNGGGYSVRSGTSQAAAQVAGAAALLWLAKPSATFFDVKTALLNGGDLVPGSNGFCISNRTLNAFQSLRTAPIAVPMPFFPTESALNVGFMRSMMANRLCLSAAAAGSPVVQAACQLGNPDQIFTITRNSRGGCENSILSKGACVGVENAAHTAESRVLTGACNGSSQQNQCANFFRFGTFGPWQIQARHSSMCMQARNSSTAAGTDIVQVPCAAAGLATQQQWDVLVYANNFPVTATTGYWVQIQTVASNRSRCLDVFQALTTGGTKVVQNTCSTATTRNNQHFELSRNSINTGGNYWYRINTFAPQMSLAVNSTLTISGAALIQSPLVTGTAAAGLNQEWHMVKRFDMPSGGDVFFIVNRNSRKCLEVPSSQLGADAAIQQRICTYSASQQFALRPVA